MKTFKCGNITFNDDRPLIMGILNVTPDSFSDGGNYLDPDAAVRRARTMAKEGADIIDIGGASTRPGAAAISTEEELERVKPVLDELSGSGLCLSIDTTNWRVALYAAEKGVNIINDVSGRFNSYISTVVKGFSLGWIMTHTDGADAGATVKRTKPVSEEILDYFDSCLDASRAAGIADEQICLDPGFGFAKTTDENSEILGNFAWYAEYPTFLMCALSRKRFLGDLINEPNPVKRDFASAIADSAAVVCGANIVRTHNVRMAKEMLRVLFP